MRSHLAQSMLVVFALFAGYALGALRAPAQADDSGKIVDLLRDIARAESGQVDALKQLARSAEKCAR